MPRILVADDNSNIQRMVALALKDAGIDVVAVGNGEAAVRKLPDAKPDLVLADIFMPVRSGYEVCEFIKKDPRYSHLPVVLLVGAFDPLDEREAQRVGADGILKKPFVPPDPLINMVKDLLAKSASEQLVAVAVPVASSSAEVASVAVFPPKRAPSSPAPDFSADLNNETTQEFASPVGRLDFSKQESPLAFSDLLAVPAVDDADLTVTASRDPVLGEPAWNHVATTGETSEDDATEVHSWGNHAQPIPLNITGPALPTAERDPELEIELPGFGETSALPAIEFGGGERAHAADPSLSDLEPSFAEASPAAVEETAHSEETAVLPHLEAVPESTSHHLDERESSNESAVHESAVHEIELPELPGVGQPWETKPAASEETPTQDPDSTVEELPAWLATVPPIFPPPEPVAEPLPASQLESLSEIHAVISRASEPVEHIEDSPAEHDVVERSAMEHDTVEHSEIEHQNAASVTAPEPGPEPESAWHQAAEAEATSLATTLSQVTSHPAEENPVMPTAQMPDPDVIEAIVTRIVERMQPKVFDVVTREILRPLVEALVNREIGKHEINKH